MVNIINPVRNPRGVFESPRGLFPSGNPRPAERGGGIISNGIKDKLPTSPGVYHRTGPYERRDGAGLRFATLFKNMINFTNKNIPRSPGVYFFKRGEAVLYVGKAANLKSRVASYFQKSAYLAPLKQRLVKEANKVDWEQTPSEIEALLLESHYIKKYQPRYNVLLRDDKTYLSVKITDEEYPRVLTTRKIEKDGTYFGPFTDARAVKETLKILRRFFPYRSNCSPFIALAKQGSPFVAPQRGAKQGSPFVVPQRGAKQGIPNSGRACLYYHLGLCPGVCAGKMTALEYRRQIKHIKDFFAGKRQRILTDLKKEFKRLQEKSDEQSMKLAEKTKPRTLPPRGTGAWVKYKINNLEKVLMMARVLSFGEKVEGDIIELAKVLGLKNPPHRIEGYDVSNIMGALATASMIVFTDGEADKSQYRKFKIKTVRGANDVAMLKEVLHRRFDAKHHFKARAPRSLAVRGEVGWPLPDLVVIDGGRPQLGAAMEVWREFNLKIPMVSLAKRYEEIFVPNQLHPIVLPRASPALHLLERARDEAHRFAVSYHKLLRRKKFLQKRSSEHIEVVLGAKKTRAPSF